MALPLPDLEPSRTAPAPRTVSHSDFGYHAADGGTYSYVGPAPAEAATDEGVDPWNADLEYYVPVATVDGRIEIIQNRRKADRRGPKRRADDRLADLAEYVERLEQIRNQTARGWAMFAMGFSSGMVMVLLFMFLTS